MTILTTKMARFGKPGESVKNPRYTGKPLFLFVFVLFFMVGGTMAKPQTKAEVCEDLQKMYGRGFLTQSERDDYCFAGCSFLKVSCSEVNRRIDYSRMLRNAFDRFVDMCTRMINGDYDDAGRMMLNPDVNEATIEAWLTMVNRTWGIFLCFVPVLLNQYKYYNFLVAVTLLMVFMGLCMMDVMPVSVAAHNVLITCLSLMHGSNSSHLVESVWTSVLVLGPIFALFIFDPMWHLMILGGVFLGFIAYLQWCFFTKRTGMNAGVVVAVTQVCIIAEQMWFVKTEMGERTLGGAGVEAALCAIIPDGDSAMFFFNASRNAVNVARRIPFGLNPVIAYACTMLLQGAMFAAFRASLGAFYLHILRYRTDFGSLMAGFFVYSADFFGPATCLHRIVFGRETYNTRRVTYAFVGLALLYFEVMYAREFAVFRFVMSLFDGLFLKSRYGRMTHYLAVDVDFMQAAFPHDGAPPWVSVDDLIGLSRCTGVLVSKDAAGRMVRGLGVVLNSAGRSMLYSVKHVVAGSVLVNFKSNGYASPDFRNVTNGSDPLMSMKIEDSPSAPEVDLLTPAEVFDVEQLLFTNCSDGGDAYVCIVPEFKLLSGRLNAVVNLKKGDSGGPCFAVLRNGIVRLCGVVSRGNPRNGGGNIISFCYSNEDPGADSSDDDSLGANVTQFNRVRRTRFASDDPDKIRWQANTSLANFLKEHAEAFEEMKDWDAHFKWSDLDGTEEAAIARIHDANYPRLEEPPNYDDSRDDGGTDYDDGGGVFRGKKHRRQDAKRRNKDKAYRKQAYGKAVILGEKLKQIYSSQDAESIFHNIVRGHVPELKARECVTGGDGNNWHYSDSLPDAEWT